MFNRLLGKLFSDDDEVPFRDLPPEEQEAVLAEEKADRIKFHRKEVRNGPVKWNYINAGQQRRKTTRAEATRKRKVNKRHRRSFMAQQHDTAILRGMLQAAGELPYAHGPIDPQVAAHVRPDVGAWFDRNYPTDGSTDPIDEGLANYLERTGAAA